MVVLKEDTTAVSVREEGAGLHGDQNQKQKTIPNHLLGLPPPHQPTPGHVELQWSWGHAIMVCKRTCCRPRPVISSTAEARPGRTGPLAGTLGRGVCVGEDPPVMLQPRGPQFS